MHSPGRAAALEDFAGIGGTFPGGALIAAAGGAPMTVRQVAELYGVHVRTAWRMAATGDIPAPIRISERVVRWRLRDIERHIERARRA